MQRWIELNFHVLAFLIIVEIEQAVFFKQAKRCAKFRARQLNIIGLDLVNQIPSRHKISFAVTEIFQIYFPEHQQQMILQRRKRHHIGPFQAYCIRILFAGSQHAHSRLLLHDHIKTNHSQVLGNILSIGFSGGKLIQFFILIPQYESGLQQFSYAAFEQMSAFLFYRYPQTDIAHDFFLFMLILLILAASVSTMPFLNSTS